MQLKYPLAGLSVAAAIIAADQWSKEWVLANPAISERTAIEVTSYFNLVLVYNRGVSFGMFSNHDQPLILSAVASLIVTILLFWLWQNRSLGVALAIGSVIGGAIGNVIDRLRYEAVVDFFDFHYMGLHWPAFNIADSCIFIGVAVLCVHSMFFEQKNHTKE